MSAFAATAFVGDDDETSFYLASPRIYSPEDKQIAVEFGGQFRKGMTLQMNAYRIVDPVAFFLAQQQIHSPVLADSGGTSPARRSDVGNKRHYLPAGSWTVKVDPENRYWHRESLPVPVKEKGVYLVTARNRGKEATTVVVVTELGMITKQSSSEALAFVVERKSGQKVPGMPLQFLQPGGSAEKATTGGDGVARIATTTADRSNEGMGRWGGYGNSMVVLGEKDGNLVISDSYFYAHYGNGGNGMSIYLHTDRPVYRPAQEVNFRGIARKIEKDGTYRNVTDSLVAIEVTDPRGGSVYKDTTRLSDFGTFNGSLTLGDEPPLGDYNVKINIEGTEQWFRFAVEEYKKPEYEVKVITDREQYTRGDKISATVKADYYFGSPVSEATVEYMVFRTRYYRPWWYGSEWAYLYGERDIMEYGGQMEMVHNGSGTLKADGTYQIEYQTDAKADADWTYRIQANVVDNSRRMIAGDASVRVTRGEFHITAWTDRYVYTPGDNAVIKVRTASFSDDKGVAASFTATVKRTWWESRGKRGGGTSHSETVWTGSGSTDGNGNGSVTFKPEKPGYFTVEVKAKDSRGTEIGTSTSVYVADETYAAWYQEGAGDMQIIPDKALYSPGETMSALVIVPEGGFDMFASVEGSTIYRHTVERLGSTSAIIRIPIEERYAPMVYLSASAIWGDQFHSAEQRVSVIPKGKKIRIEVTTDKPVYKPGENAVVKVRALLDNGEPAPATDIALGMVDEAIYAIRPDQTPDITAHFYGVRYNSVNTATSLNFNFYWNQAQNAAPVMASGATAEMGAADGFAARGGRAMEMKSMAPPPPPPMPGADSYVEPTLRTEFKDMMFWTPSVRTGSDGRATLNVTFPDNLTTWRITARGVTQATAVGQTTAEVIARKDLLVRMETPRFMTEGDELVIATTVHNYLSTAKQTKVEFVGEGVNVQASEQTVTIPANGEKRIDWRMKAPKTGQATLRVRALTNEESDAMELKVPILPRGLRLATSQMIGIEQQTGTHSMSLAIPANTVPGSSSMTLAISPSAASSIIGALDALIGYPYGCVEQTMSRFLPTVVVADALKKIDVPFDAVKREEMPKMVAKGFERLGELQHSDGGWGWWTNDETNPFMTAYVLYGMTVARDGGYAADPDRYARGVSALHTLIKSNAAEKELTTRAYMLYVASFIGERTGDRSYRDEIATLSKKKDLNNYGKALLALAAVHAKDRALAERIAAELEKGATSTDNAVYWKGSAWHYQWQDDEVETTAYVVKALLAIRGETEQVGRAVQWLLKQKEGDSWHNTRQTAMTIYALVDYVQRTKELDPSYDVTISVNGQRVFTHHMTKADVFAPEKTVTVDPKILRSGDNVVSIEKSGGGKLYTSARLVYYATGDAIKPASAGFSVSREYYTLEREKVKGSWVYTKRPYRGTVKSGDEIFVKVKVRPDSRYDYFMLEDPLPAGCEVITETSGYVIPGENGYSAPNNGGYYRGYTPWNWWYADRDVRDEKVAFFAPRIEAREYEFSYILRAQIPGDYSVMPSVGALMYYPEIRGNSGLIAMRIVE